jgi:hypothetical protein
MFPSIVFSNAADGSLLTDSVSLFPSEIEAKEINKYAQRVILGVMRPLSILLIELSDCARKQGYNFVPDLIDHFGFFVNVRRPALRTKEQKRRDKLQKMIAHRAAQAERRRRREWAALTQPTPP